MNHPSRSRLMTLVTVALLLLLALAAHAQDVNPDANISWPPPVYVLRGQVEIRGTVDVANMTSYFLEFRALGDNLEPDEDLPPEPATLPSSTVVQDGVLGIWDTTQAEDGLYELWLTVNISGGQAIQHQVSPLRVENEPPPFAVLPTQPAPVPQPVVTQEPVAPSGPTATIAVASANVRSGDSTDYPVLLALPSGTVLPVLGISNRGTRWYQVTLPDGRAGWVAPSVVSLSGDTSGLPSIQPPPIPATRTPTPTPTPAANADLVAGIVVLDPATPTCQQTFTVGFDVANLGNAPSAVSGVVSLVDSRAADGSSQGTTVGGFPILQPGQTFRVNMPLTISTYYNEVHRITLTIDAGFSIPDRDRSNNTRTIEYTLQKGGCP
ncbi:MAG: SH3 domain-containing protein [Anaerolineae bacterium]|nr:SH3 domain-containing protein [Anaerolineae bacterium]